MRSRNLPHWTRGGAIYWITFRLADSLPQEKVKRLQAERRQWESQNPEPWDAAQKRDYRKRFAVRVQNWLDAGYGSCVLREPAMRQTVCDCLLRFDGDRLKLHAAVVMPNHVHAMIEPLRANALSTLLQGIKGASARLVNQALGRSGAFWMDESYDRIVRHEKEYDYFMRYIRENPVKARLADDAYWLYCMGGQ
jgi:REP element-mobilizing transposase RayT